LDVHHGRDIILADDAGSFAQAVISLLRDPQLRHRYETAAAQTAARYDWPAIGERFSEVLQQAAEKKFFTVRTIPARLAEKKA
jgi:glycosyltransferase involved in cell wall biosynthesis